MTIYEIAKQALAHLEYGTDEDTMSQFIDRFTVYINDAARVVGQHLKMEAEEPVMLHNDHFNIDSIYKRNVTKIVEVYKGKRRYPFVQGDSPDDFKVLHDDEISTYPALFGDVNLTGNVTAADATAVLLTIQKEQYGEQSPLKSMGRVNADVDGDGKITENDSELILKYVNHTITKFPVEDMVNGLVYVRFRYMPDDRYLASDEPDIPAVFHPILWMYVVHMHHNSRATASDYDRTKWLQEFERQRKILTRAYGALDTYQIKNKPWQTGEM